MERVYCPRHDESTPSCVIYDTHAFCYGGCGRIPLTELGISGVRPPALPPVNLADELARIKALPRASVRGLSLPVDAGGYYIVWPCGSYYKYRRFLPGDGPKYVCPRGHKKPPLFCHEPKGATTLAIVEGEINALSIASLNPPFAVCSPGGVGDFKENVMSCTLHSTFSRFLLILDRDQPGLDAAIKMKKLLLAYTPHVEIILMSPDANDLLVRGELRKEVLKWGKSGNADLGATRKRL